MPDQKTVDPKRVLAEIQALTETVESRRRETDRLEGQLAEVKRRLKEEFGCETIDDAVKKAESLDLEIRKIDEEIARIQEQVASLREEMERV